MQDKYELIPVEKENFAFQPADGANWYNVPIRDAESFRNGRIIPLPGKNKYAQYRPGTSIPAPDYFDVSH